MSPTFLAGLAPAGFLDDLATKSLSPGWAKKQPQMWASPRSRYIPAIWRYVDARAALEQACDFVSPELAERRNLIMVNPIADNVYPTSQNLVAAYQLVLPGETARSHRHTPNALRLILDAGAETYTIVNGVKIDVAEGDVVLTPSWHWHGHTNSGDKPAFWIDFLDVPLVQKLENMFFQDHPERNEPIRTHEPDSPLRHKAPDLERQMRERGVADIAPGGLKTIGLQAVGLKAGQTQHHQPRIESNIYVVTAGDVRMDVDALGVVEMSRGDVIVIPCWHRFSMESMSTWAQLVRVTDAPLMDALGFEDVSDTIL